MSMPGHPASRKQREAQAKSAAEGDSRQFSLQNFPQNTAAQSTAAQSTAELAKLAVEPPQSGPKSEPRPIPTKGPVTFERKYDRDLKEVEVLYNNGDWDGAIKAAKSNLSDPSLPRRHIIKDHLIRAHAAEFYAETEEHRLIAEKVYAEARMLTPRSATQDDECLRRVRKDLDDLKEAQEEDLREFEEAQEEDLGGGLNTEQNLPSREKKADNGEGGSESID